MACASINRSTRVPLRPLSAGISRTMSAISENKIKSKPILNSIVFVRPLSFDWSLALSTIQTPQQTIYTSFYITIEVSFIPLCIPIFIPYQLSYLHPLSFFVRYTFYHMHSTVLATIPAIPIISHSDCCNTFRTTISGAYKFRPDE